MNNNSGLSSFNSFSIKNENDIHGDLDDLNIEEDNMILTNNSKVIVYNISDDFLIQMNVIGQCQDPNFIKLQYYDKNEEVVVNKNDIFYQTIDSFENFGNLCEMKIINELAVLKNIQMRLLNRKNFCYDKDIFINLNTKENEQNDIQNFFIDEFLRNIKGNDVCMYLNVFNNKNNNECFEFIHKYFFTNNYEIYCRYENIFIKLFSLINNPNGNRFLIHFNVISDKHENYLSFNYIPILSSNIISNELYENNIIFSNINEFNNEIDINKVVLNKEIDKYLKELYNGNQDEKIKNFISSQLITSFLSSNYNINYLNTLYDLFKITNLSKYFIHVLKLLFLSFLSYNYRRFFPNEEKNENEQDTFIDKNLIFYSNIINLILFKYINSLINSQFINNKQIFKTNSPLKTNNLVVFFNLSNKEDDILINEVIKQRVDFSYSGTQPNNKNCISKFITLYLNKNVTSFYNNFTKKFKETVSKIDKNFIDISFLKTIYKANNILNIFTSCFSISLSHFSKFEINIKKIYQFWNLNLYDIESENIGRHSYDNFFSSQEKIIEFLQISQIIEYSTFFHNIIKEGKKKNNFFREYSFKDFFSRYLPILSDIDNSYNPKTDYTKKLSDYLDDINSYQGNDINTSSKVDSEKKIIFLSYNTFEILNLLLKNVFIEKIIYIQSVFRRYNVYKLINNLRNKCIRIQSWYKLKLIKRRRKKEFLALNINQLSEKIVNTYKNKDPFVIRFIINNKKKIEELEKENKILQQYLDELNEAQNNQNEYSYNSIMLSQSENSNENFNSPQTESTSNIDEINYLNKKLSENRKKFQKLVMIIAEYEQKMKNFVQMINSNDEVKEVLYKNGISIN